MKTCSKCRIEKPFNEFYRYSQKKDGYDIHCKQCVLIRRKENKHNPISQLSKVMKSSIIIENKLLAKDKKRLCGICHNVYNLSEMILGRRCKECNRKYDKDYSDKNKDKKSIISKKNYEKNREKRIAKCVEYSKTERGREVKKKEYIKNKEKYIKRSKERYEEKKEDIRQKNITYYENNKDEINRKRREKYQLKKLEKLQNNDLNLSN